MGKQTDGVGLLFLCGYLPDNQFEEGYKPNLYVRLFFDYTCLDTIPPIHWCLVNVRKLREFFGTIFFPFVGIFIVGALLSLITYSFTISFLDYDLSKETKEKQLDAWSKIIGLSISVTGFLSIIVTITQGRKSTQHIIHQATVELFREFRGEKFSEVRSRAWDVREKWYSSTDYKSALLHNSFSHKGSYALNTDFSTEELASDIKSLYDLFEFYAVIGLYKENRDVLCGLHYFYYGWWRSFLYDVAEEIDKRRSPHLNPILYGLAVKYIENISMIEVLKRLDELCDLDKVNHKEILHRHPG